MSTTVSAGCRTLSPRQDAGLTEEQDRWLRQLDAFDAPFLADKLLADGAFDRHEEFEEAFVEFKRFVAVSFLTDGAVGMTSDIVDTVWHQFILFTPQYHEFCDRFIGHYLHHVPRLPEDDGAEEAARFFDGYEKLFGEAPDLWKSCFNAGQKPQCAKPRPPSCSQPPPPLPRPKCGPRPK